MGIIFSITGAAVSVGSLALTSVGFTPWGIAAGSSAASVQSTFGNVVAGSAFAGLQSLGATGALVSSGAIGAGVAIAGVVPSENRTQRAMKRMKMKRLRNTKIISLLLASTFPSQPRQARGSTSS